MKPNQTSIILASVEPPFVVVVLVALVCDGSDGIVAALILVTAVGFVVMYNVECSTQDDDRCHSG